MFLTRENKLEDLEQDVAVLEEEPIDATDLMELDELDDEERDLIPDDLWWASLPFAFGIA